MLKRSPRTAGFIEPCLPSPTKAPPAGSHWIHEIKHDGFRILARRGATEGAALLLLPTWRGRRETRRPIHDPPPHLRREAAPQGRLVIVETIMVRTRDPFFLAVILTGFSGDTPAS